MVCWFLEHYTSNHIVIVVLVYIENHFIENAVNAFVVITKESYSDERGCSVLSISTHLEFGSKEPSLVELKRDVYFEDFLIFFRPDFYQWEHIPRTHIEGYVFSKLSFEFCIRLASASKNPIAYVLNRMCYLHTYHYHLHVYNLAQLLLSISRFQM